MKRINTIWILLTTLTLAMCGQKKQEASFDSRSAITLDSLDFKIENFQPLPEEYKFKHKAYLIDKITPPANYAYWECIYKDALLDDNRGQLIVYNGDSLNYSSYAKSINSENGFFVECHPGICFSYIVGVHFDKTVSLINSNLKLKKFIGEIESIEEVILIAKLNGYWYDTDTLIGGAYNERENDYFLYLLDYSSTPVTYKSTKAVLTKKGSFKVISKETYRQTDEYIME